MNWHADESRGAVVPLSLSRIWHRVQQYVYRARDPSRGNSALVKALRPEGEPQLRALSRAGSNL